jgi:hypothetical protein
MVLEHEKIIEYKIDIIEELLKERNVKANEKNLLFYEALEQYQEKLKVKCNYSDYIRGGKNSNREEMYESNSFSIGSRDI